MTLTPVLKPQDFARIANVPFHEPGRPPQEDAPRPATASLPEFPEGFQLLDDVGVMTLPDPDWLVIGVIPKKGIVTIYSPPNTAKTTLTAGLSVSIATGRNWFGHEVKTRGSCIYVPSEDVSGFKIRLAAAKTAARLKPDTVVGVYTFPEGINLLDYTNVTQFIAFVKQHPASASLVAVFIDTLSGSMPGGNENAIEAMGLATSHAKLIMRELDVTVILLHHTNASGTRERGHTAVRGESDTMIALEPVDDIVRVENNKQRNAPYFPAIELRVVPCGPSVVVRFARDVELPADSLSDHQRRLMVTLRDTFSTDGAASTAWMRAATATGMSESSFYRAQKVVVQERGYVSAAGSVYRLTPAGLKVLQGLGL